MVHNTYMHLFVHAFHRLAIPGSHNDFRPHLLRHKMLALYSSIAVLGKVALALVMFIAYPSVAYFSTVTTDRIVELVNVERVQRGLPPLEASSALSDAAEQKSFDMLQKNYFSHWAPDGTAPWTFLRNAGYLYTFAGENLAMGFSDAEGVVAAWMQSDRHRENILSPNYHEIGVYVREGTLQGKKTTLVVEFFGTSYVSSSVAGARTPSATALTTTSPSGAAQGERTAVTITPSNSESLLARTVRTVQNIYGLFLGILIVLLLVNITMRAHSRHAPIIVHGIFVMILLGALLSLNLHFLELPMKAQMIILQ